MRYAIFSDIHANRQAWEAVLADALQQGADTLVCLGDVVGYGPRPQEVLAAVREVTPNFVLGNHDAAACGRLDPSIFNERARVVIEWTRDRLDEESLSFLGQVPLQMDGAEVQFVHAEVMEPGEFGYVDGIGPAELNLQAMSKPLGFIGHTHLPLAFTMPQRGGQVTQLPPLDFELERGKRYLVNVGSVGEPRTTDVRASYVIYDDIEKKVYFRKVIFDVEAYKEDLAETGLEIRPYFVQVVDAGKVAGAPAPAAAPQLALAHLPKVTEVVVGHHGHLVLGTQRAGPRPLGGWTPGNAAAAAGIAQPKSISTWLLGSVVGLVLLVVVAVIMAATRKDDDPLAAVPRGDQGGTSAQEKAESNGAKPEGDKKTAPRAALIDERQEGPIRRLTVRRFPKSFASLAQLREANEANEFDARDPVEGGLLDLAYAGEEKEVGVVWSGYLIAPESGDYEFFLAATSEAAVSCSDEIVLSGGGSKVEGPGKCALKKGRHTPFRVEYYCSGGAEKSLSLQWSGPGIEGKQSLMATGESPASPALAQNANSDPRGDPAPLKRDPRPDNLSADLLAYWSFDDRKFDPQDDGSLRENLIMERSQPVEVLVPSRDIGKAWTGIKFDAADWKQGKNGVGYEDVPGEYEDLLATRIESEKGKHPTSVYIRIPFEVEDPEDYVRLALYMRYDDAFSCYLNGRPEFAKSPNAPIYEHLRWNSAAVTKNEDGEALSMMPFAVTSRLKYLKNGRNVLAIHAMNHPGTANDTNTGSTSSDMLIQARLVGWRKDSQLPAGAEPGKPAQHLTLESGKIATSQARAVQGKFGEAFDIKETGIEIGEKDKFAIGDHSFTVSLWFTRDPNEIDQQARRLISAGAGNEEKSGWALWVMGNAEGLSFAVSNGVSRAETAAKWASIADGQWHHAVATVDRGSGRVALYLDGALLGAEDWKSFLDASTIASNSGLMIGGNSDGDQHHRGKLDDVALWHRALDPEEITNLFESGQSGKGLDVLLEDE